MKDSRKFLRLTLTVVLLTVLFAVCASAETATSGSCGDSLTWSFDSTTGELTISGTGDMATYTNETGATPAPWYSHAANITKITVEEGVETIGKYAFNRLNKATSVSLPTTLKTIGYNAFRYCSALADVTIPDGVELIDAYAFNTCEAIPSITIPGSVKTISNHAFNQCYALTDLVLEEGIETIKNQAFNKCTGLTTVVIPSSVTTLGGGTTSAFAKCELSTVVFFSTANQPENQTVIKGTFPDTVTTLVGYADSPTQTYATANDTSFVTLEAGASLTSSGTCGDSIDWLLFSDGQLVISGTGDMTDYTSATAASPSLAPWYNSDTPITSVTIGEGVISVGNYSFNECSALKKVTLPSTITSIGSQVFRKCSALSDISIPDGVTSIGSYAFNICSSLKSIVLPGSITTISSYAFTGCSSLSSVIIEDGFQSIGNRAFNNCTSLTSIIIPASVTNIGVTTFGFAGCSNLTNITVLSTSASIPSNELTTFATNATFYGYAGSPADAFAKSTGRSFVPFATDCTTVFELSATFIPDAANAGVYSPIFSLVRTNASNASFTLDLLFVEGATGALHIKNADGDYKALCNEEGNAFTLGDQATAISIVYDDAKGTARYYVNGALSCYGENKALANDLTVSGMSAFASAEAVTDTASTLSGVTVSNAYNINPSGTADYVGFQVSKSDSSSIRILAGLDMLYYSRVGFEISLYSNGNLQGTVASNASTVFSNIVADDETISATSQGYRYLTALIISGIDRSDYPDNVNVYFIVKTFTEIGGKKQYGEEKKITVTQDGSEHVYTQGAVTEDDVTPVPTPTPESDVVLRFIASSDIHITDSAVDENSVISSTSGAGKLKNAIEQILAHIANDGYTGLDAVVLAGDIVNTGTDKQYANAQIIFDSIIPENTELVITMGNHDYGNNSSLTYEEAMAYQDKFEAVFGDATKDTVINGYHFITITCDERLDAKGDNGANMKRPYGYDYSADTIALATKLIEDAVADTPDKPVFVIQHVATSDTIGGSTEMYEKADGTTGKGDTSDSAVPTLLELESKYPNLIVFSGHSHFPINDVASIFQKDFTALNTGVLGGNCAQSRVDGVKFSDMKDSTNANYDPNVSYSAGNNDDVYLIEVDSNNCVTIRIWDSATGSFIGETWTVDSFDKEDFKYTKNRYTNDDIFFADGAAVTQDLLSSSAITVTFPSVPVGSVAARVYKLVATATVTGNQTVGYVIPEYYLDDRTSPISATISGLTPNMPYTLEIYALNPLYSLDITDTGTICSKPLTLSFTTRREGGPDIIQFEIDTKENTLKSTIPGGLAPIVTTTPNVYYDSTVGMNVVAFDGTLESAIKFESYKNIGSQLTDGMTFEAYLKVDELPTSSTAVGLIASCQNSGGFGLFADKNGNFVFRYNNGEAGSTADERTLTYAFTTGVYYHVVAVHDGTSTLTLYINGEAVGSDTDVPLFRIPDQTYSQQFYMGADVLNSTTGQNPSKCTVANFGLYSKPLTADQVKASYKALRAYAPKTPDIINIAFDVDNKTLVNTVSGGITPTIKGQISASYDATIGRNVASFTQAAENTTSSITNVARFDLDSVNDLLVDGMTFETYVRVDGVPVPAANEEYVALIGAMHNGGFGLLAYPDGTMKFGYWDGSSYQYISFSYAVDQYYHVVAVLDGTDYSLYVNGQLAGTATVEAFALPSTTTYRKCVIGADSFTNGGYRSSSNCTIAQFNLYSEPMTAKNVAEAYAKLPRKNAVILEMTETSASEGGVYGNFNAYVQTSDPSGDYYVRYNFDHAYSTTATGNSDSGNDLDMFRIVGAELVKVTAIGETAVTYESVVKVLQTGEIALAIKEDGAVDFVGGYHGDEHFATDTDGNDLFALYADGEAYHPGTEAKVVVCTTLTMDQKTVLDRCNTDDAVMTHNQHYSITSSGITVRREVEWLVSNFTLQTTDGVGANCYLQLFTMYRVVDGKTVCETVETFDANGNRLGTATLSDAVTSETRVLHSTAAKVAKYSSATSGISGEAGFTVIDNSVAANAAWIKVREDTVGDNKWYASFSSVDNGTTPVQGEVWKIEAFYHVDYINPEN